MPALVQTGAHGLYATEAVDKEDRVFGEPRTCCEQV